MRAAPFLPRESDSTVQDKYTTRISPHRTSTYPPPTYSALNTQELQPQPEAMKFELPTGEASTSIDIRSTLWKTQNETLPPTYSRHWPRPEIQYPCGKICRIQCGPPYSCRENPTAPSNKKTPESHQITRRPIPRQGFRHATLKCSNFNPKHEVRVAYGRSKHKHRHDIDNMEDANRDSTYLPPTHLSH